MKCDFSRTRRQMEPVIFAALSMTKSINPGINAIPEYHIAYQFSQTPAGCA